MRNTLTVNRLARADLHSALTCSAANSNLTAPRSTSLRLQLLLPPLDVQLSRLHEHVRAKTSYQVTCTARGSRPAARIRWIRGSHRQILTGVRELVSEAMELTCCIRFLISDDRGSFTGKYDSIPLQLCLSPGLAITPK